VNYTPDPGYAGDDSFQYTISDGRGGTATATVRVTVTSQPTKKFDFGTAASPVAPGYTQVTPATTYSMAQGYGWLAGIIGAADRGTSDPLKRDLNYGPSGTFAVDLPNGSYTVTLTMGDSKYAHDKMGVFLQGTQVDTVSTAAGQVVTKVYTASVSSSPLAVRLVDQGGSDPNFVINGLEIAASSPAPPQNEEEIGILVVPDVGPAPLEVQALALGVPPSAVCDWDFGDGIKVNAGGLVTHTYYSAGTYAVTLTVGGRTARATVVVGDPPSR